MTTSPTSAPPLFHVALHQPEIPNNTGNIGRTCVAAACRLHLVHPLGFSTSEKACRRAGLDYWARLAPHEHPDWDALVTSLNPGGGENADGRPLADRIWVFTTKATRPAWTAEMQRGDVLLFGKETEGLPASILSQFPNRSLTFPMAPGERSLNLATAVCAAVYEGVRQLTERNAISIDASGRLVL